MLVGRRGELSLIRQMLAAGRFVVIAGPAGIGKTTLARAALGPRSSYREGGALATLAWSPLLVFRRLLRADPPELPDEVAAMVVQQGAAPLLLDDLQWADDASLHAVARLGGSVPMVATVRTGEVRSEEVLGALELVGATRIDLDGLGPVDAEALVAALHPDLSSDAAARLLEAADGNPLLLGELPKGQDAAPGLLSALAGRVSSLRPDARRALDRLAVLGRPAPAALLGRGVGDLIDAGLAAEVDGDVVVFHSLLGEVLVDRLGAEADVVRRALAQEVAPEEGAHLLAAAGDAAAARALALEAAETGDRRRRAGLLELAASCAIGPDVENRVRAARLYTSLSEPATARRLCQVPGREALPAIERGALLGAEAEAAWLEGKQAETADLVERALADLAGSRTGYEVAVMAGSTVVQTFVDLDGRPALDRARDAVRLADEIGEEQGYARTRLASVLMTAGEPGWADLYREVIELGVATADDDLRRTALVSLVLAHWATGDASTAESVARTELAGGPRQEFDVTWLTIASYAAVLGLVSGRSRAAIVDEFRPLLERWTSFRSRPFLEASVVLALADSGQHREAALVAEGSVDRAGPEAQWRSLAWWARVDAAWLAGRSDQVLEDVGAIHALQLGDYPAAVLARLVGAHAARERGLAATGPAPSALLPAWRGAPVEWAALEAASAGDAAGAVDGLLAAADAWTSNDVRSEVRCRWAAGDVAASARREDAVLLLEEAEARAIELGSTAMVERIRRSLRTAGVQRRSGPGVAGLTGREEQVLDLVGAGMRSADVAAALGIEVSTVESFIRSAMQKLGARTRAAAAAQLDQVRSSPPR